ncbi:isochorismatase family cysteine hydrolase [Pseudoduganella sp. UC29_106]|uniref:isochorismatase family cysteine hydrolase n=1 Tax=Pseudoduganella sp. UC29_106 TaxID=3374553 RepID=UPI003756D916
MNTYPSQTTAIVLVDVLNDFLAEEGKLHGMIAPMVEQTQLVSKLQHLLQGARAAGVKVFYSPHGVDEHSFDDVRHVHPRFQFGLEKQVFWKGSWGADFYEPLKPQEGDVIISQHRMFDSFIGTDLEQQLRANGIEHVVLAGLTSHTCVEGTGRHALEAGFHVTFLSDGVAEFTEAAHRAALDISYPTFGHATITIDEFLGSVK